MESYDVTDFFHWACFQGSSMMWHVSILYHFLLISTILFHEYITFYWSIISYMMSFICIHPKIFANFLLILISKISLLLWSIDYFRTGCLIPCICEFSKFPADFSLFLPSIAVEHNLFHTLIELNFDTVAGVDFEAINWGLFCPQMEVLSYIIPW